jgi:hypothetical protein
MGTEGEDTVVDESGELKLRCPARFAAGTVKAAAWQARAPPLLLEGKKRAFTASTAWKKGFLRPQREEKKREKEFPASAAGCSR